MLLEPVRIKRPDLRDEVRDLVELVCQQPAGHEIPLTELVRVLGIQIAPDFRQQLAGRGDLHLRPTSFFNQGPAIQRRVRLLGFDVTLRIASQLTGRLTRFNDSFQLAFESERTVALSKFLFNVELRHLDLNRERIFVDFVGAQDVFIELE